MLPKLPYKGTRREKEIVAFLGLNRTEATREGEVRDAKNMTVGEYPTLVQRKARTAVTGYEAPSDIYEWDGHLVVVDGGVLYYDGEALCNVSDGKKQYAVVNTKLIVWPDKLMIDLTNSTVTRMGAEITNHGTATLGENYIEFTARSVYSEHAWRYRNTEWPEDERAPWAWVYESASFSDGEWTLTGGALVNLFQTHINGKVFIPRASVSQLDGEYVLGPLRTVYSVNQPDYPEPEPGNDVGYYSVVVGQNSWGEPGNRGEEIQVESYFAPSDNNFDLTDEYEVGDIVNVDGTHLGLGDCEHAIVSAVTSGKLTVDKTFVIPVCLAEITEDTEVRSQYKPNQGGITGIKWTDNGTTYYATIGSGYTLRAGHWLLYVEDNGSYKAMEWDPVRKIAVQTHDASAPTTSMKIGVLTMTLFDSTMTEPFTVSRDIPNLDYICAHENRLWGVSNRVTNKVWNTDTETWDTFTSRVIYASELGQPMRFWTFSGADTDSYQVAVGSEDDFTAICDLGGVCCWKEHELVRVLGSYPSEFYTNSYRIEGVAEGCSGSLTIVNETLYYVGTSGVYAFRGTRPSEIGKALGTPPTNAVGGSDGQRWYLSGLRGDTPELLTFDIGRGMWMREDDTQAEAFAVIDNTVHFLAGGVIYRANQGDDPALEWYAEFVPFDETKVVRRRYIHLALRLDMSAGSKVTVAVQYDGGAWTTLLDEDTQVDVAKRVAFPPRRCDRMTVRISGTGTVKLRHMEREFYPGSERV